MLDIARGIVTVAKKARDGKLTMDDLTGGTFTITNGGVFGSLVSTPIINYPAGRHTRPAQDAGSRRWWWTARSSIRPMMYVALSYDHRIIDGQQAVLFLVRLKELMEDPALMVVESQPIHDLAGERRARSESPLCLLARRLVAGHRGVGQMTQGSRRSPGGV